MMSIRRLLCVLFILAATACAGLASEPRIVATIPPAPARHDLAEGAQIFAAHCASCHGENGQGDGGLVLSGKLAVQPPDFTDPTTATPADWFATITNGRLEQFMPPWRDRLSERARWAVAMYTYTLNYTRDQLDVGQAVWTANCNACHQAESLSIDALSDADLFDLITQGSGDMPAFGDTLTATERSAVTAYTRTRILDNTELIGANPAMTEEALISDVVADIRGQVSNGTGGGSLPRDWPVTLHIFDRQFNEESLNTPLKQDGTFLFTVVPVRADRLYAATIRYQNRVFSSSLVPGHSLTDLPITIYEPTDDASQITITNFDLQIVAAPDTLQVAQIVTLRNSSDRVFSSDIQVDANRYASVIVPLPTGAQVLDAAGDTQRYVLSADGGALLDTQPVLPNKDHVIHLIYALPYSGSANIRIPQSYALDGAVEMRLQHDNIQVTSEQLTVHEPQTLAGMVFQNYGANLALHAGDSVRFSISGGFASTTSSPPTNWLALGLIAIGGLLLLAAGITYVRRKPVDNQPLRDLLIEQIAELDHLHAEGKIDPAAYQEQRTRLKERLAKIISAK